MPMAARPEELILFTTPEFQANVDVEALAGAFNVDRANMPSRTVMIPAEHFGIDGCQAIMTTSDFFVVADQVLDTTSQYNAVSRQTNYFLHHWEIISASRFVPAVMFTTDPDTEVETINITATGVSAPKVSDRDDKVVTTVTRGEIYNLSATVANDANVDYLPVAFSVNGAESSLTYVRNDGAGVLHVGIDEDSDKLTIVARSVYTDPEDVHKVLTNTSSVTVAGDKGTAWPAVPVVDTAPTPTP